MSHEKFFLWSGILQNLQMVYFHCFSPVQHKYDTFLWGILFYPAIILGLILIKLQISHSPITVRFKVCCIKLILWGVQSGSISMGRNFCSHCNLSLQQWLETLHADKVSPYTGYMSYVWTRSQQSVYGVWSSMGYCDMGIFILLVFSHNV